MARSTEKSLPARADVRDNRRSIAAWRKFAKIDLCTKALVYNLATEGTKEMLANRLYANFHPNQDEQTSSISEVESDASLSPRSSIASSSAAPASNHATNMVSLSLSELKTLIFYLVVHIVIQ